MNGCLVGALITWWLKKKKKKRNQNGSQRCECRIQTTLISINASVTKLCLCQTTGYSNPLHGKLVWSAIVKLLLTANCPLLLLLDSPPLLFFCCHHLWIVSTIISTIGDRNQLAFSCCLITGLWELFVCGDEMYLGGIDFLSMKSLSTTFPPHWKTASHALPGNHFIVTRIHPEILHYLNSGCHLTKVSIANWQRLKERVKSHICPCVQRKGKSIHCNSLHYHITTFLSSPGALYMTNRPMEQLTLRNRRVAATNHCQTPIPCKYT